MGSVFRIFWKSVRDFWDELFILVLMNLLTMILLLPVVTFPPALAGLWSVGNLIAQGKGIAWSDYFQGFKRYFGRSWLFAVLNILVLGLIFINVNFYVPDVVPIDMSLTVSMAIRTFFIFLGILWILYQMYPMAMLLEQEEQRVFLALRNAGVLLLANPGFTLVFGILLAVVGVVSVLLPALLAMLTLSFFAVACNNAVVHLLIPFRERLALEEAAEAEESGAEIDGDDATVSIEADADPDLDEAA